MATADRRFKMAAEKVKVFVFKAPCICRDFGRKRQRSGDQEAQSKELTRIAWKETHLHFDGAKFVRPEFSREASGDSEKESGIRLDYSVECLQESLTFYLDSEFLGCAATDSAPAAVQTNDSNPDENHRDFTQDVALQNEFQCINEASQRLLLESFAPSSDLLEDSEGVDKNRGSERLQDEDIESADKCISTHPCVADDVYTQNWAGSFRFSGSSSSASSEAGIETAATALKRDTAQMKHVPLLPRVCDRLSNLVECTEKGSVVNIVFVVLQVNIIREIQIRSGPSVGQYVPLSSLLVADESKSYFKLTLWREASSWTERILPGDFMVATSIQITSWRSENVGQTMHRSNLYNLHQPNKLLSTEWCRLVSQERLDQLISWTKESHPFLFTSAHAKEEVVFRKIAELEDNTLVHFRGLLTSVNVSATMKGVYSFRHEQLPKIVLSFCETPDQLIKLCLWGQQAAWVRELQAGINQVWEMLYVTVKYDTRSSSFVLHSTPKSSKKELTKVDPNASEIHLKFAIHVVSRAHKFNTITDLFEAQYSGAAEIEACVSSVTFHVSDALLRLTGETSTKDLGTGAHKFVYAGCGTCSRSLTQDKNGIYTLCAYCVTNNPLYKATVSYCYKPFTVSLTDGKGIIEDVEVKHDGALQLFQGFPARNLAVQTDENLDVFTNTVRDLILDKKPRAFVLLCHTSLDENSFVVHRHFSLGMFPSSLSLHN